MDLVRELGEDKLIQELAAQLPGVGPDVYSAIGDDCAIVRGSKRRQLLKTDCVIEGVHFTSETLDEQIGWKALCRPLSDIAAMGGKPRYALITLAVPPETSVSRVQGIYAGIGKAASEFGVDVVGGETARSPGPCFISVCITGEASAHTKRALRSGGQVDDILYVTGRLGGSLASGHHLSFRPRLEEGRWLVRHFSIHAMMDLSDGLGADLPRLARGSGCGFQIEQKVLPCSEGCDARSAISDGEDYELLFAVSPRNAGKLEERWHRRFPELRLTPIGTLTPPNESGELSAGFDHFR